MMFTLAFVAAAASLRPAAGEIALQPNNFCAGSPLTIDALHGGSSVTDIHVVVNPRNEPVGWIYLMAGGRSYLQANERMSAGDQRALDLRAGDSLSELRSKPAGLPSDLNVRACRGSEIGTF
jgi:hypothetical protein